MMQDEALASLEVVTGMLTIFDRDAYVLFDPGAHIHLCLTFWPCILI